MRFTVLSVVAAATLASAQYGEPAPPADEQTTTLTSTSTQYVTVTECGPDVPDCPYKPAEPTSTYVAPPPPPPPPSTTPSSTSTSKVYHVHTSSTKSLVYPPPVETPIYTPTTPVVIITSTTPIAPPPAEPTYPGTPGNTKPAPPTVPSGTPGAASGVMVQTGLVAAAFAAVVAALF